MHRFQRGAVFVCPEREGKEESGDGQAVGGEKEESAFGLFRGREGAGGDCSADGDIRKNGENVLSDRELLEPYRRRSEAAKLRAQICVNESAEEAARRQAQMLRDEETRVRQQAAKDILDRAGVRVPKEEKKDIQITFTAGMPKLGMPGKSGEQG